MMPNHRGASVPGNRDVRCLSSVIYTPRVCTRVRHECAPGCNVVLCAPDFDAQLPTVTMLLSHAIVEVHFMSGKTEVGNTLSLLKHSSPWDEKKTEILATCQPQLTGASDQNIFPQLRLVP